MDIRYFARPLSLLLLDRNFHDSEFRPALVGVTLRGILTSVKTLLARNLGIFTLEQRAVGAELRDSRTVVISEKTLTRVEWFTEQVRDFLR